MQNSKLKLGDVVTVNIRGVLFDATVTGKHDGKIQIEPVLSAYGYREATPRQILRRTNRPPGARKHRDLGVGGVPAAVSPGCSGNAVDPDVATRRSA